MAERFGERCRCWLLSRGRRPNVLTIIATLFLIVIAVQRRDNNAAVDDDRLRQDNNHRRHQCTVSRQRHTTRDATEHTRTPSVIGVFLLVNVDDIDDQQWNSTLDATHTQVDTHNTVLPAFCFQVYSDLNKSIIHM